MGYPIEMTDFLIYIGALSGNWKELFVPLK